MAGPDASEGQAVWQPEGAEEDSRLRKGNGHLHLAYDEEEDYILSLKLESMPTHKHAGFFFFFFSPVKLSAIPGNRERVSLSPSSPLSRPPLKLCHRR